MGKKNYFLLFIISWQFFSFAHQYYSQVGQDQFLHTLFPDKRDGVMVDIGANDGVKYSNSLFFEQQGWQCLCIEPHPRAFAALQKNRSCICIQCCIADVAGAAQFLKINGACEMLSGLIKKYDPRHVGRIAFEVTQNRDSCEIITVPCYTLEFILKQYDITHIDILSLDIEGGELEILQSIENLADIVDVICVEDNYNDQNMVTFLEHAGFSLLKRLEHDLVFRNNKFCVK